MLTGSTFPGCLVSNMAMRVNQIFTTMANIQENLQRGKRLTLIHGFSPLFHEGTQNHDDPGT